MTSTPEDPTRTSDRRRAAGPQDAEPAGKGRFATGDLVADRYRIVSLLGRGGMGEVYRAEDLKLKLPVALKLLPARFAEDPGRLARFHNEVRIARQVSHPNVCRVHDIGEVDGLHFLSMEYVDGEDLASLLRRIGRLPADKAKDVARQICAGLAAAHDGGVLHRDLKPANVMIDGRGRARLTDFGLAVAMDEARARGEVAGTPAYMAPEQIAGAELSERTDVYALGLVLYELFTGQAAFRGASVTDVFRQQRETTPAPPSRLVADLDPEVERAILRCLAKNPDERPPSAHAVAAALLGGNVLDAAIAAGETPSPEMVAAAATVGDLRPAVAWACLLAGLAGLVLLAWGSEQRSLTRYVPLPKPPEALAARAQDVQARLGYVAPAADRARGFVADEGPIDEIARTDPSPARWERLRSLRPSPLGFFYRESPEALVAATWTQVPPWVGTPELGRILSDDPPLTLPGMTEVRLDPDGRLVRFVAVPPRFDERDGPWPEVDWSTALADAGLDPRRAQPVAPRWAAPVDSDRKVAWDVSETTQPDATLHAEAAAYHGRPVYFEVLAKGRRPALNAAAPPAVFTGAMVLMLGLTALFVGVIVALARRNLRLGRGDRRGAARIATFGGLVLLAALLLRADHTPRLLEESNLGFLAIAEGCYGALLLWSFYLALEPVVRRRWPHALVSWSRLLSGRFRDAMVGRDVLLGLLAGLAIALVVRLAILASTWLGHAPPMPSLALSALADSRHAAYGVVLSLAIGPAYALSTLLTFYLLYALVRRLWLVGLLLVLEIAFVCIAGYDDVLSGLLVGAVFGGVMVAVLLRLGLLSLAALWFTFHVLIRANLTLDFSAWYAGRSLAVLLLFAALLAAAAYTSLGGKPLFGRVLFED